MYVSSIIGPEVPKHTTIGDTITTYLFFVRGNNFSVIVTENFTASNSWGKSCNAMIGAVLPCKRGIILLQLQFFSRCCVSVLVIFFQENTREFPEIITSTCAKFWLRFAFSIGTGNF